MWRVVLLAVSSVYLSHAALPLHVFAAFIIIMALMMEAGMVFETYKIDAQIQASYIKPCARTDPEFNKCALKSGREAIPQVIKGDRKYKVPQLDPLSIEELKIADDGSSRVGLSLVMKNAKVYGMRNSELQETNFDFVKKHNHHEMVVSHAEIIGKYEVNGRVLLLPITGSGDINITLENTKVTYDHDYTLEPVNGQIFMVIKNPTAKVTPVRAYFHLTNLFNGDPVLGNHMNNFLDENWRDVYKELSPAVITAFTEIITAILTGISNAVPFDVGFPEKLPSD